MTQAQSPDDGGYELVSVVMPVFNGASTLPDQLAALARQTYQGRWELVVADNGSTDATAEIVRQWSIRIPDVRVVQALERQGCSYARNVGARAARGDFIACCDADDLVDKDWLQALVAAGRSHDIVGGRLDVSTLNNTVTAAWRPSFPVDRLPVALGFLPYAVGANCAMSRETWEDLGGWDEDLAFCGDDIEFAWRAQMASYTLGFAPEAVVAYRFRDDPRATAKQFYRYGRVEPALFSRYRRHGVARSDTARAVREWVWAALRAFDLTASDDRKGAWMRKVAYRAGRLVGSLRARTIFL